MPHNVDKAPRHRPYKYVGWDKKGGLWRIHKDRTSSIWWAMQADGQGVMRAMRLKDLAAKLLA